MAPSRPLPRDGARVDLPAPPRDGAAMRIEKAQIDRLALSARVLEGWEAMGGPMGTPAELLRMIENEIAILAKLRDQAPAEVDELVAGYGRLADACRVRVN